MGQPYEYNTRQYEYYYDNDDNDYLLDEDIDYAKKSTPFRKVKREAIIGKLSHTEFMDTQRKLFNEFNSKWDEFLLDTEYAEEFYNNLNLYIKNKEN